LGGLASVRRESPVGRESSRDSVRIGLAMRPQPSKGHQPL